MTASASPGEQASLIGVRYVLFDAVGTLIYPDPPAAEAYHAAGQRFGSSRSVAEIRQRFQAALAAWNQPPGLERPPTDEAHERRRWQSLVETVFSDVPHAGGALFDSLWEHFAQPQHWRLYDDVPPVLQELRSRGLQLGIASNFDARLLAVAAGHGPLAMPDATFISSQIGYSKPDPRFFQAVEKRLNARPHELVLVGDDPLNDTAGAVTAGWHAVELDRHLRQPATGQIRSLAELVPRLAEDRFRRPP